MESLEPSDQEQEMIRLHQEILEKGVGSALPSALSDEWLTRVSQDLECLKEAFENGFEDNQENMDQLAIPLALVFKNLWDQGKADDEGKIDVPLEDLFEYLKLYAVAVRLEQLNRSSNVAIESPTLENLFNPKRKVTCRLSHEKIH